MPPHNVSDQSNGIRRRPTVERVIPAIPLALSRPRPSTKPNLKPKPEPAAKVVEEHVTQRHGETNENSGAATSEDVRNGVKHGQVELGGRMDSEPSDQTTAGPEAAVDTPGSTGSAAMSISAGQTPELPSEPTERPSTPPAALAQQAETTPSSSRKAVDRFDMRQIRTELPPAFVPSAEQRTPRSANSNFSSRPDFLPHAHPTHPSAGSIVFGGPDSNTSSPAPPLSSGFVPPPPCPPINQNQPSYYAPPGHAHHASEPYGQRMFQPPFYPPVTQYGPRPHYVQPPNGNYHAHPPMPFRYPPREVFTPAEAPQPNGPKSRSGSHASSTQEHSANAIQTPLSPEEYPELPKANGGEPRNNGQRQPQMRQRPLRQPRHLPAPSFLPYELNVDADGALALRDHLLNQLTEAAFTDCQVRLIHADGQTAEFSGHRIVFSRSPALLEQIRSSQSAAISTSSTKIELQLSGKYEHPQAFIKALQYLYGAPYQHERRIAGPNGESLPHDTTPMDAALQFIAAGDRLKAPGLSWRGAEAALELLSWDSVTPALLFALEGGISHEWTVEDGSEDRASTSSSDDSIYKVEGTNAPRYGLFSTHLLIRILGFIVHMFPASFYLDASTPQLGSAPRLPALPQGHESRPSRADPRLTQIRFGEIPVDDHQRPSFTATTISSILLSFPFVLLKNVLEHPDLAMKLGSDTVSSIMRQVVAERETRRSKALKAFAAGQLEVSRSDPLVQNLFWEESVEPSVQHRAGSRLARRRVEIDTPPSSGACSERMK